MAQVVDGVETRYTCAWLPALLACFLWCRSVWVLHPYAYAFNNPVNLTDPSGHFAPLLIPLILGGAIGGGFAAVAYMQAHPCADFWSDPAFQRAVGVGILAGIAGGAAGLGAGIALGFFIPSSTLMGAVVVGTFAGAVGGGATQVTANALTGQSLTEGLTRAVLVGAAAGGVGGAVGYGVGKAIQPRQAIQPSAEVVDTDISPYAIRIHPKKPGPMAIDTSTFTSGEPTKGGGLRNARQFWRAWREEFPETLSDMNKARIDRGKPPIADDHWIGKFPQHTDFKNQVLEHHHLDYGIHAIPLPYELHRFSPHSKVWHP